MQPARDLELVQWSDLSLTTCLSLVEMTSLNKQVRLFPVLSVLYVLLKRISRERYASDKEKCEGGGGGGGAVFPTRPPYARSFALQK